ncbi:hypothetical protein [Methylovulum sp.]|uniref:hypothetical protein n=1 Tax=Methylovulum sp. TaxID=1916980 RepID=UPI002620EA09|nr:hypothetical protein [Methylovulum sp.]MDD5125821.1 hypothetical protein [Methylovulum sp.]
MVTATQGKPRNQKTQPDRLKADDTNLKGTTLAQTKPLAQSPLQEATRDDTRPLNAKPTRPRNGKRPGSSTTPQKLDSAQPAQTTAAAIHKTRTKATNQQPAEFGQGRQNQPTEKTGGDNYGLFAATDLQLGHRSPTCLGQDRPTLR